MVWRTPSVVHHCWVNVCTIRCSQETNLPLMKLLIHLVALYSTHLQLVLVSLANCSPIDCTPSSPGEQCESQMFFSLSLSHLITQISFQISRFSSGVWNTVWCWGFFFLAVCSRVTLCFERNLKLHASVAALGLGVTKPCPQIMHQTDALSPSHI